MADRRVEFAACGWGSGTLAWPELANPFPYPTSEANFTGWCLGTLTAQADRSKTIGLHSEAVTSVGPAKALEPRTPDNQGWAWILFPHSWSLCGVSGCRGSHPPHLTHTSARAPTPTRSLTRTNNATQVCRQVPHRCAGRYHRCAGRYHARLSLIKCNRFGEGETGRREGGRGRVLASIPHLHATSLPTSCVPESPRPLSAGSWWWPGQARHSLGTGEM